MDISKLSHDKAAVSSALMYKDQAIVAKANVKIMIPSRYFDIGISTMEPEIYTFGVFALIVEDKFYACSLAIAMMRLTPTQHYEVLIDDVAYTVFEFDKGSVITPNRNLVMRDTLVHYIWDLLISQGNWPWFIDDKNVSIIFEESKKFTGVKLGNNAQIVQMVVSTILRVKSNLYQQYRHGLLDGNKDLAVVALRSVIFGPSNTFSRLNGPYFKKEGLPTALVNTSEKSEPIEEMIRG